MTNTAYINNKDENIYLSLQVSFEATNSEELYGVTKYNIDIYKYEDAPIDKILVGKMDAFKFQRDMIQEIFFTLDFEGATAPFIELFDDDEFKDKVLKAAGSDGIFCDLLVLNRLEILPEFRGKNFAGYIFDIIARTIGYNTITAFIAFPLQLENGGQPCDHFGKDWREQMNFSTFSQDTKKATDSLTKYYQKFGFRKVRKCSQNILVKSF